MLVGFMASGKSTVGAALARRLGWAHVDLDREIERRQGLRIADIFRTRGEPHFRSLERDLTREWANRPRLVLSPGGGWITHPGILARLGPGTRSVWLRVSPKQVLARAGRRRDERPLLAGPDPIGTIRRLLAEREALYAAADFQLDTDDRGSDAVATEIESLIRARELLADRG